MKAIICGGRGYNLTIRDCEFLSTLHDLYHFEEVITGGATGADTDGQKWAELNHIPTRVFPANWTLYGGEAGPIRNRQMLKEAGADAVVIAFKGGNGTVNMMNAAKAQKIRVIQVHTVKEVYKR